MDDTNQVRREVRLRADRTVREDAPAYGPDASRDYYADYVLYRRDGKPLAIVEAKRSSRDPLGGERQAEEYADRVEANDRVTPFIYLANGNQIWFLDRGRFPIREISQFYTPDDLERLAFQRQYGQALSELGPKPDIINRPYQFEAVKRMTEALENGRRRFLLVMATGTGKTRLLQALAETFIALEQSDEFRLPFPITLVYDRTIDGAERTVLVDHRGGSTTQAACAVFNTAVDDADWLALAQTIHEPDAQTRLALRHHYVGEPVGIAEYLPNPVLVYTSGNITEWTARFAPRPIDKSINDDDLALESERPLDWDVAREQLALYSHADLAEADRLRPYLGADRADLFTQADHGWFLAPDQLKLAVCAVVLDQALRDWRKTDRLPPDPNLKRLLDDDVNWRWPVSLTLSIDFQPDRWGRAMADEASQLRRLLDLASAVVREPEPGTGRRLVFDLGESQVEHVAQFMEIFGGPQPRPFDVFRGLRAWQQQDLLRDVTLTFLKHHPQHDNDHDLLLHDWLSDGEQMLLGRIALFYLLQGQDDALLILDEPETHFNDAWKRNLADIIEQALLNTRSHVILTTHASIVVTDAYSDGVILLTRSGQEVNVPLTLASEQGEALRAIFDVDRSTGRRAERRVQAAIDRGTIEALESMLDEVGPGHFRFKIVRELQKRVPPDQLA